ncbi:MAG: N-acetyl-alpha-D-glucosaminyl L-malate synthase BshA [Calditrichaeota bacterium]|nr:N-acetyl-alpha-D-glucosaminyl L-malate synthase BshA [Calditrichota bacterium]
MIIGISCWPTFGGSGVVAAELGMNLAERGHEVHFVTYAVPERLNLYQPGVHYHEVTVPDYPLFEYPPYSQALASKMAEVAQNYGLDILHAHYAIPHAASALLAREIAGGKLKVVTTLHGTDITLVGRDPSFMPVVRHSILRSNGVTAVSKYLRREICRAFTCDRTVEVIYNFIDPRDFKRLHTETVRQRFAPNGEKLLVHISNFRPVKRVPDIVEVFLRARREMPVRLILIGSGPELPKAERTLREAGAESDLIVLGTIHNVLTVIAACDAMLLPSDAESFGLSALEAMGCGVPVVGYQAGGLPEVIDDKVTGFLSLVGDIDALTQSTLQLLNDGKLRAQMGAAAKEIAFARFNITDMVDKYEDLYRSVMME